MCSRSDRLRILFPRLPGTPGGFRSSMAKAMLTSAEGRSLSSSTRKPGLTFAAAALPTLLRWTTSCRAWITLPTRLPPLAPSELSVRTCRASFRATLPTFGESPLRTAPRVMLRGVRRPRIDPLTAPWCPARPRARSCSRPTSAFLRFGPCWCATARKFTVGTVSWTLSIPARNG